MRKVEPTDEQLRAILTPGNLLVRAGAGSGKTEVLARRFAALVAGDLEGALSPEHIVAITFTEKATYDMRERIREVLEERVAEPRGADPDRLRRAQRALPMARISTIHAFCARILRENPIETGLDPAFEVLDEYESETFAESKCRELVIEALRAGDPGAIHLLGARRLRGSSAFREGALEIVTRVVGDLQRLGKSTAWLRKTAKESATELARYNTRENALALKRAIEDLLKVERLAGETGRRLDELRARWPKYCAAVESFDAGSGSASLGLLRELCTLVPEARAKAAREPVNRIRELLNDKTSRALGIAGELVEAYGAERAARPTLDTAELVARIADQLETIKRREAVVTFDDLLALTERLLRDEPAIRLRYRTAFGAILVDEYQDTNPIQDSIVRLLTEPDGDAPSPQLFIVGDEKQSIYRFRGADVTVFNRPRRPQPTLLTLRENRRSTSSVLRFVNALSARVMRPEADSAPDFRVTWKDEDHRLVPTREPLSEPSVEIVLAAPDRAEEKRNAADYREIEAAFLARRVLDLVNSGHSVFDSALQAWRPAGFGDVAILLRSFNDVSIYEQALRNAGVPWYTVKGRGFFGCREILDLADLITVIDDPCDAIALAAVLRSPLFTLSDRCLLEIALHAHEGGPSLPALFCAEEPDFEWLHDGREQARAAWETLRQLRDLAKRASLVEVVERALEMTEFEAVMLAQPDGRQRVANIRKLAELAMVFEAHRFFGFSDFAAHLRRLVTQPPNEPQAQILGEGENVVRLMTIHQAKGLEFPIVIVADLGRGTPNLQANYLLSPDQGLLVCDVIGSGREELPNPLIHDHRKTLEQQEAAEAARLLYVAITRARDLLILSEGVAGAGWSKDVRAFIGENEVSAFVKSGKTEQTIEVDGARILLRVAAPTPQSPRAALAPALKAPAADELKALASARLAFRPPPELELIASPTELADFERCPRQYQLRHRLGLPEGQLFGANGDHAIEMGTVAHAVLERLEPGIARAALDEEIARLVESFAAGTSLGANERAGLCRDLGRYARCRDARERIVGREVPFFLSVGDGNLTLFVRGRIDLLVEDDRRLLVRDYKYARAGDDEAENFRIQMECYALAAESESLGRKVEAELVFLRDDLAQIPLSVPQAETICTRLIAIARAMLTARESGEYPRKPPRPEVCRKLGCGYIPRCWPRAGSE